MPQCEHKLTQQIPLTHLHELNRYLYIISSIDTLLQGMPFSVTCQMDEHALISVFLSYCSQ